MTSPMTACRDCLWQQWGCASDRGGGPDQAPPKTDLGQAGHLGNHQQFGCFKLGQEDEGVRGGIEELLREQEGRGSNRTSRKEAEEATRLDIIRDLLTSGFLLQEKCGGHLVNWLVDTGLQPTCSLCRNGNICRSFMNFDRRGSGYHARTDGPSK